jgi:hypothetical protein
LKSNLLIVFLISCFLGACGKSDSIESFTSMQSTFSPTQTEAVVPTEKPIAPTQFVATGTPPPQDIILLKTCKSEAEILFPEFTDPLLPLDIDVSYELSILPTFSEVDADLFIEYIKGYPFSLDYRSRGYHNSGCFYSHKYIRIAEDYALSRFPESQFASEWQWDRAYNFLMEGNQRVYDTYASLLAKGLNNERVSHEDLSCWFN